MRDQQDSYGRVAGTYLQRADYAAMARGYGMKLSNEDAQKIVDGWRARNTWARTFGDQCEGAAFSALNNREEATWA